MSEAPERIWANTGLYWDYRQDWTEGSWKLDGSGIEYVRADCVDALIAMAYDKGIRDDPVNYYPPKKTRAALDDLMKANR